MGLRVLHVSNHTTVACGVGEFGRQLSAALQNLGHEVTNWDGGYPACYARGYWPKDLGTYDVVHLNWQPNTLNHYQPEVQPSRAQFAGVWSVFLHDLPPWSTCAFAEAGRVDVIAALEPGSCLSGKRAIDVVIPPPCLAYRPVARISPRPTVGRTGLGEAGVATLEALCAKHRWDLSLSPTTGWVSNEEEIDRLARCWVNVVWYQENRSRSSSASIVATARRPTVLSYSTRFDHLRPWQGEFYWAEDDGLEEVLVRLMDAIGGSQGPLPRWLRRPERAVEGLQWGRVLPPLVEAWEQARAQERGEVAV